MPTIESLHASVIERLCEADSLDDPIAGRREGLTPSLLAQLSPVWDSGNWRALDGHAITSSDGRTVEEYGLVRVQSDLPPVPVAIVWDGRDARVYYNLASMGRPPGETRSPICEEDPDAHAGDVVGKYQEGLHAGDLERILACLSADVYFQAPSGDRFVGFDAVRDLFASFAGAKLDLRHNTITDDGSTCALEFTGAHANPPRAGIGIYVRGPGETIAAIRIYE